MEPSVYTAAHGLHAGITATFENFVRYDQDFDHTPNGENRLVYGGPNGAPTFISFNAPIEVPSFWVTTGPFGSPDATVTGSLNGSPVFSFVNSGATDTFHEVVDGAGNRIDRLTFTNFRESELDDIVIQVPDPVGGATLFAAAVLGLLASGRPRRPLLQTFPAGGV
jgi:hypothetical protein